MSDVRASRQWAVSAAVVLVGCASAGPAPIYELRPTQAPLRYHLVGTSSNEIETPGGEQATDISSEARLLVAFGDAVAAGRELRVTIESFAGTVETAFGRQELGGDAVAGRTFEAVVDPAGGVTITRAPEIESEDLTADDLVDVVAGVVVPLPPGGAPDAASWPHRVRTPIGSRLDGETVYEGTARFAGDTVWNGIPARVIVSEGAFTTHGSGAPEGAPGEIELSLEGKGRTRYIWDPGRGVLLGLEASSRGKGDVLAMGFTMPMTVESRSTLELAADTD